jgi:hypothetical protein
MQCDADVQIGMALAPHLSGLAVGWLAAGCRASYPSCRPSGGTSLLRGGCHRGGVAAGAGTVAVLALASRPPSLQRRIPATKRWLWAFWTRGLGLHVSGGLGCRHSWSRHFERTGR